MAIVILYSFLMIPAIGGAIARQHLLKLFGNLRMRRRLYMSGAGWIGGRSRWRRAVEWPAGRVMGAKCPKLIPPRVSAARIRTAFNGWVTARRFQGRVSCCLDCGGDDSIEHDALCATFHR